MSKKSHALSADELRALFAKGVLRHGGGGGKGGRGKIIYTKKPPVTLARNTGVRRAKAGFNRGNHHTNAVKSNPYGSGRFVIGGKTAGLRGGGGSGRRIPSRAERDATRAERLARARLKFVDFRNSDRGREIKAQRIELQGKIGTAMFQKLTPRQQNKLRLETYRPRGRTRDRASNAARVAVALHRVKRQQRSVYAGVDDMSRGEKRRFMADPKVRGRYAALKRREERIRRIAERLGVVPSS